MTCLVGKIGTLSPKPLSVEASKNFEAIDMATKSGLTASQRRRLRPQYKNNKRLHEAFHDLPVFEGLAVAARHEKKLRKALHRFGLI